MTTRVVVEPHADDAFLSLGGHIEQWTKDGDKVIIATVFSETRKRARDAMAYAKAVKAVWVGLGASEWADPRGTGVKGDGETAISDLVPAIRPHIPADWHDTLVYAPLGIKHPEHKEVRKGCEDLLSYSGQLRVYLDQPYAATQSNGDEVLQLLEDAVIKSYLKPHARKYRHVKLFKDQAKFFHFNPPASLAGNVEMIVIPKQEEER